MKCIHKIPLWLLLWLLSVSVRTIPAQSLIKADTAGRHLQPDSEQFSGIGISASSHDENEKEVLDLTMRVEEAMQLQPSLRFTHLGMEQGLSNGFVTSITQDRLGFMWFGTRGGLFRFDGYRFTAYKHDPSDPQSLSDNVIWHIFEDRDGSLWISTHNGGVNRFDPQSEKFTRYLHDPHDPSSLGGNMIFCGFQDSQGNLWFGGPPFSGLNKLDPATQHVTRYLADPAQPDGLLPRAGIWKIEEDAEGYLWFAADFALTKFDPKSGRCVHYQPSAGEKRLSALLQDHTGGWWLGGTSGLYAFDPTSGTFRAFRPEKAIVVTALYEHPAGTLWIGSREGGLYRFSIATGEFTGHFLPDPANADSLSNSAIGALYADASGIFWIGTSSGLDQIELRQQQFQHYRFVAENSVEERVTAIDGDGSGRVWLAQGNDLLHFDPDSGETFRYRLPETGIPDSQILATHRGRQGELWLGRAHLLERVDSKSGKIRRYDLSPIVRRREPGPPINIFSLYEDEFGMLWLAAEMAGLLRFDPQKEIFESFANEPKAGSGPNELANIELRVVSGDRAGHLWLGYQNGRFSRFDLESGRFTYYGPDSKNPDSFQGGWVESVYPASNGIIWIGTLGGLSRFDPRTERFRLYSESDGLADSQIEAILEDADGMLWLGTSKGLSRFDPEREEFRNYDVDDGVGGRKFSGRAAWKDAKGRLYFGGSFGLTVFSPDRIVDNAYKAPVVLTELRVDNIAVKPGEKSYLQEPLWETKALIFQPWDHSFSLEFAALSYAAPHKNRYRYILEGFDQGWTEVDSARRFATYTRLDAGEYVFRVQGSNNNGVWSDRETRLKITVLPHWWETFWFRAGMLLALTGLIVVGYHWRIRAIEGRNRVLEFQVAERTRELQAEKELADSLRQKAEMLQQKAEVANQAKSAFLANMSHELRSPLNAVIGFAQVMAHSRSLASDDRESLGIIRRSGEHLLTLINQVLDLSKIEAGRMSLDSGDFDLHLLLRDVQDMFALRAEAKGLHLLFEWDNSLPQYIRTDQVKLRQVLINLLNNAIKFTEEGGVAVRVFSINNCQLHFEIEDSGVGIAPEELEQIFEAFGQSESGRQAKEGTGLGLPISRKFVRLMGGDMQVKSEVGHGSLFTFHIQVTCVERSTIDNRQSTIPSRAIALEPGQPSYRILIVDDRRTNRQLLVKLLSPFAPSTDSGQGFELREAANGQEAIDICTDWKPHLIWMDMRMPVVDGYEATRRIREWERKKQISHLTSHIKIIALTASSLEQERSEIFEAGCDAYLRKPFRETELFELISEHLGLRFVYEEEQYISSDERQAAIDHPLTPEDLAALPDEWLETLKQAAEASDVESLLELTAQIRERDASLADALMRLAEEFEYDEILDLLSR